ncbi:MAG: tryptophan 7-halogenase [Planctomycetaceae bacterium]|nr:tryptophan 7-halogenase [Planctomycetaceae bacterium]
MALPYDILILGSGFGGSLLATILSGKGMQVALIDRSRHPRFIIGESSTPLADFTLQRIARSFDLPELLPLTQYGSWKRTYPDLVCGMKRGFTYFGHTPGRDLLKEDFDAHRLLVAASRSNEVADTHWLRSDVDQFFFQLAVSRGVSVWQSCEFSLSHHDRGWNLDGQSDGESIQLQAPFAIDATGRGRVLLRYLNIPALTSQLKTHSSAIYAHFADVRSCEDLLMERGVDCRGFPFSCDAAAVHHVLENGWMWQLPFDDGTVSAGFLMDPRQGCQRQTETPSNFWNSQLAKYPFLQSQFRHARIVRPKDGLCDSGRLQYLTSQAAGADWAALPLTAGFIDPLHSTGIAHTLVAIERLAQILGESDRAQLSLELTKYSEQLIDELRLIDELVDGCYAGLPNFRKWCLWAFLYLAAITSAEQAPDVDQGNGFLQAANAEFREMLIECRRKFDASGENETGLAALEAFLRESIGPWNQVGLLDPAQHGLYVNTAAPSIPL